MGGETKELYGHEGQPFPSFDECGTYIEGVTLTQEQAIEVLHDHGFDTVELRGIHMRYASDACEVQEAGGEGDEGWLECPSDHPDALPFWKDRSDG
jgi:hypothetical protein